MALNYEQYEVLTFDCYGTLIDWEAGIITALRPVLLSHGHDLSDEAILTLFAAHESDAQHPWQSYRDVLATVLDAIGNDLGFTPTDAERAAFGGSVVDWPAFDDARSGLGALQKHYRLAAITNCDDDLFAASQERLGVKFDYIITAEQARAYKPDLRPFHLALEAIALDSSRVLHVAQSLFHDHVPAAQVGLTSVWVNRRSVRPGSGATPAVTATPDHEVPDLATLVMEIETRAQR